MLGVIRRFQEWRERERVQYEERCRRGREITRKWDTEIKPLPLEEARRRAELLLADPDHFHCETEPVSDQEQRKMEILAPHLRAFFERFSTVKHVKEAGEYLDRSLLWFEPVCMADGKVSDQWLTIGWMGEENTLIVKQAEEAICMWGPEEIEVDSPSIYHLILQLDLFGIEL